MVRIRDALRHDLPELLRLMRALAEFEGYSAEFRVTEAELRRRGFGPRPEFFAKLAECEDHGVVGMAVCHLIPFTFDLRPTLVLKELYVDPQQRGRGIGEGLLRELAATAQGLDCGRLRWDVLAGNAAAERFYQRLGGRREEHWIAYRLDREGIERLAPPRLLSRSGC